MTAKSVRDSDCVVRLLCLVGAARWRKRKDNPAFWDFADVYFGKTDTTRLSWERDIPDAVFVKIEKMCMDALKGTPLGDKLYDAGHPYNDMPLNIIVELAAHESLELWKRGVKRFPERCSHHYLYGAWLFDCFCILQRMERHGVEPSKDLLLKALRDDLQPEKEDKPDVEMMDKDEREGVRNDMSKGLQVFCFEKRDVRVVMKDGMPWWVAKDVCDVLDIKNDKDAISRLDADEKSGVGIVDPHGRKQRTNIINESGLYTLIMRSNKPEAKRFRKWVTSDLLPAIRKTGEYATPEAKRRKADKKDELALRRIAVMEKNADYRMAKLILEGIEKFNEVMTPESKTVFMTKYAELTTKQDLTHMLPQATEAMYSATDIGRECGVSAQKIGKVASENGLKSPKGVSGEYGTWVRTKSPHSSREVITFVYNERARGWFLNFFGVLAKAQ